VIDKCLLRTEAFIYNQAIVLKEKINARLFNKTMLKIKFHKLKQALDKLGFQETWVKGPYVKFNNPQANAIIVLSSYERV
jgi:predicted RNA binding protein YcfA (HicA-like mRNA interferase family)